MTNRARSTILAVILAGCASEAESNGGVCIAPANPGGGWDLTCRATAQALGLRAPDGHAIQVTNLPGEGGGRAFAKVAAQSAGGDATITAASPSTLLGLAQHHYGTLTEKSVRWIAAVAAEPSVIAVRGDAPWRTLGELVSDWRAHPDKIAIGGGSVVGGQDHMKILLLARAAGVDIREVKYLPLSGPLEAITSLKSDSIQIFPGDASEVQRLAQSGQIRILAVLADHRSPGVLASIPTAREQGFDVTWIVWRGFYGPPGMSDASYAQWIERLHAMTVSKEWKSRLGRNGLTAFYLGGADFERFVADQIASYRTVSREIGITP